MRACAGRTAGPVLDGGDFYVSKLSIITCRCGVVQTARISSAATCNLVHSHTNTPKYSARDVDDTLIELQLILYISGTRER